MNDAELVAMMRDSALGPRLPREIAEAADISEDEAVALLVAAANRGLIRSSPRWWFDETLEAPTPRSTIYAVT